MNNTYQLVLQELLGFESKTPFNKNILTQEVLDGIIENLKKYSNLIYRRRSTSPSLIDNKTKVISNKENSIFDNTLTFQSNLKKIEVPHLKIYSGVDIVLNFPGVKKPEEGKESLDTFEERAKDVFDNIILALAKDVYPKFKKYDVSKYFEKYSSHIILPTKKKKILIVVEWIYDYKFRGGTIWYYIFCSNAKDLATRK